MTEPSTKSRTYWWALWLMIALLLAPIGLLLGVSHFRQRRALLAAEEMGAMITTETMRKKWLDPAVGYFLRGSDPVYRLQYFNRSATREEIDKLLACARGFPGLRTLRIARMPVNDSDLRQLESMPQLTALDLEKTPVTDAGLKHLKGLPRLEWLVLDDTKLTDGGLESLATLNRLTVLSLERTKITDTGLVHLHGLVHLERLYLGGDEISEAAVEQLQRQLPKVTITR